MKSKRPQSEQSLWGWLEFMGRGGGIAVRFDVSMAGAATVLAEAADPLRCATWETQILPFY